MTESDIERMAREAGLEQQDYRRSGVWLANGEDLARFAGLVRAQARAESLEDAALVCDNIDNECAAAIRAIAGDAK